MCIYVTSASRPSLAVQLLHFLNFHHLICRRYSFMLFYNLIIIFNYKRKRYCVHFWCVLSDLALMRNKSLHLCLLRTSGISFKMKCQQSVLCLSFISEAVLLSLHLCFGALLCSANSGKCHGTRLSSERPVHSATGAGLLQMLSFSSPQPGCLLRFQKYPVSQLVSKDFSDAYSCELPPKIVHSGPAEVYVMCGT